MEWKEECFKSSLLSEMFGEYIIPVTISQSKNVEESSLVQKPLLAYDGGTKKSRVTQDYLELTEYIIKQNGTGGHK